MVIAEYVWIGGNNELRSKTKVLQGSNYVKYDPTNLPEWNYDGSSTNQKETNDSEIILKPVNVFIDPFRKAPNVLVICETYNTDNTPTPSNKRCEANKFFKKHQKEEIWFGLEQEFFIMNTESSNISNSNSYTPLNWNNGDLNKQGQYYCSTGYKNAYGRRIAEHAYHLALECGVFASGMNTEVAPGQWEIQVGPCEGILAGDHLLLLRYILNRIGEINKVDINIQPKPIKGWNGSGCHINFSTLRMRSEHGLNTIHNAIKKLKRIISGYEILVVIMKIG